MRQVSDSEVRKDFSAIMEAAQKESIVVRNNDRDYVAIISIEDFEILQRFKNERLKKLAHKMAEDAQENGLTPEILEDILTHES